MNTDRACTLLVLLFVILSPLYSQDQNRLLPGFDERTFAVKLYNEGMFEEAARLLEQALAGGGTGALEQALLGLCYLRLDKPEEAEAFLQQALRRDPASSVAHLGLGQLRFDQGRFQEAYERFTRAAELDPESRDAPAGRIASLINRGAEHYTDGRVTEAQNSFFQALELDPDSVPALRNLAILELEGNNLDRAAAYLEKAQRLAPADVRLQILLVQLREKQGDSDALMRELQHLVDLQPRNPDAWAKLGMLYEQHGNSGQAEAAFLQAEQWGSNEPYPYYWLAKTRRSIGLAHLAAGRAVQKAGLMRFQAARHIEAGGGNLDDEQLRKLKQLTEKITEPLQILQDALQLLKELHADPVAFGEDLRMLNDWYPHSVELKTALAVFHQNQGAWKQALAVWEQVLKDHPASAEAQAGYGRVLEQLGRHEAALLAYHRALDLDARNTERYGDLFRLYRGLNREQQLLERLREQSLREPRNPVLFGKLAELEQSLGYAEQAQIHRRRRAELLEAQGE